VSVKKLLALTVVALVGAALPAAVAGAAPVKPTDYQSRSHWLYLPKKPLKKVDVFYLCPTEYVRGPGQPLICAVDDPQMMAGATVAFQRQATAFRTVGNIYAPYYRQADAASRAKMPQKELVKVVAGAPTIDGIAAFKHFLKHYNHGRPFILVGHSLGSNVLANLLAQYMGTHPRVYKRTIAAYVVGYSITPGYLTKHPFLKFAQGRNDTGVIVSWNTEAPTVAGKNPVLLPGGLAINPISWTRRQTRAPATKNAGSIELDPATGTPVLTAEGKIKRFLDVADARVDKAKGVVICSTITWQDPPYYNPAGLPMGVLHPFDYPLYFFSVRANAADRVAHYFAGD
jgi:pimeloyl-ACP methyl ester carboxylesterase